jgi:hypothetical protein
VFGERRGALFPPAMRVRTLWLEKLMKVFRRPFASGRRKRKGKILWPC